MKLKKVSLLALSVISPVTGFSLGIRIPDQDAFATARGEAFAATADNPSAIYYNPSGITQLDGDNIRVGIYGIYLNDHYEGDGTSFNTRDSVQAVPQLYYTHTFQDVPLSVGLGLYSPYGLSIKWPGAAPFANNPDPLDDTAFYASLEYLAVNPVFAYKILPALSIAAGPTLNFGNLGLEEHVPGGGPTSDFKFNGDGFAPGFNAGILWQPLQKLSFGASYRSESRMTFNGHSDFNIPGFTSGSAGASANVPFPQNVVGGVSFRPTPKWNIEFDADWTDWHAFKTVTLSATPAFLGGGPIPLTFDWESSFFYELGVTYYINDDWHASAGYNYSENSVPDATFNPVIPDSPRHTWSLGVGSKWKNFSWDATYQIAWGPPRTVNLPNLGSNTFEYLSHAIVLAVGYHF